MATREIKRVFEKPKKRFLCPECGEEHPTKQGAVGCCPPDDIEETFICGTCETRHETRKEAEECCMVFECQECGEEFFTREDARNHVCEE